jgi:CAAX prenyl protease-like protein
MLFGQFEPSPPAADGPPGAAPWHGINVEYRHYPYVYTVKIVATLAAMAVVWPGYRQYQRRLTWLGVAVGVAGVVLWIVLSQLQLALTKDNIVATWIKWLGGGRPAFNPLEQLRDQPALAYGFLIIRFIGLAVVVPVIEEFFLRGFLMRFVQAEKWWEVPFGALTPLAVVVGTLFPMLSHPQELVAALVWFSAVTWLMARTRSIWDCVLAHAVTNLLLGIYVVASGEWWLM